jgi:hypothetical protein
MRTASSIPTTTPISQPTNATRNVNHIASSTATSTEWLPATDSSGSARRCPICHRCGIETSSARGRIRTPSTEPPSSPPTSL